MLNKSKSYAFPVEFTKWCKTILQSEHISQGENKILGIVWLMPTGYQSQNTALRLYFEQLDSMSVLVLTVTKELYDHVTKNYLNYMPVWYLHDKLCSKF